MRLNDVFPPDSAVEQARLEFSDGVTRPARSYRPAATLSNVYEKRLRILLVVESSAGGTGRHVLDLADGFSKRGHQVHLVHSTIRIDKLFQERLARINNVTCHAMEMQTNPHRSDYRLVRALRTLRSERGPFDIVHGHSSKGGALARLVAVGSGAKAFYTLHGLNSMDPGLSWWKRRAYVSIERMLAIVTHGIITVSPEEQRAAASVGLGGSKTRTIPNGLDRLELASRNAARSSMGMSDKDLVVGYVGRLVEQKAPEVLVTAFASVAAVVPQARLAIVGDGPLHERLITLSQQLEIANKIIWLGARDAREVLAGFDLFALSSRKEGLPYVILEAMAAGLPVVATSSSGVEILVEPGVNGSVVPPDNSLAFAQAIIHLLQKPTLLSRYGSASQRMIARFTVDKMVETTLSFYRSSLLSSSNDSFEAMEVAPA